MPTVPTTCSGCDNTWTGSRTCHCSSCHRTFAGVDLFDRHRDQRGERGSCLNPASLTHAETDEPVMFLRDGMWRGQDTSEEELAERNQRQVAALRRSKAPV